MAAERKSSEFHRDVYQVGMRAIPFRPLPFLKALRDNHRINIQPEEILSNPEYMDSFPEVKEEIASHHRLGDEIWGQYNAHKGLILTIIGATAAAAGVVGIGVLIKRREESNDKKEE